MQKKFFLAIFGTFLILKPRSAAFLAATVECPAQILCDLHPQRHHSPKMGQIPTTTTEF